MVLIGISGKKRSGKDTFGDFLEQYSQNKYLRYSFADPLKKICKELFMFDDEQLYGDKKEVVDERWNITPRRVLQVVGTELFRDTLSTTTPELEYIGKNFWTIQFTKWYQQNKDKHIIVPDVRFQNEVDVIKENGGIVINVTALQRLTNTDGHSSENDELTGFGYTLENNGTLEEYGEKVKEVIKMFEL